MNLVSTQPEPTRSADPASSGDGQRCPDTQHADATALTTPTRIRGRLARHIVEHTRAAVFAVLIATMLAMAALPATASAASTTPGDFSSRLTDNPTAYRLDDCSVEVGFLFDSWPYPNYRRIGGVRVNCLSRHSVIDATVAIYYKIGGRWVQYKSGTYGVRYNQTGSGQQILMTNPECVYGLKNYEWMVGATVRTEHVGMTFYSRPYQSATGC